LISLFLLLKILSLASCFLPLPNSQTGYPVHIQACFEIGTDRRSLIWGEDLSQDERLKKKKMWNEIILQHLIPETYLTLMLYLVDKYQDSSKKLWPIKVSSTPPWGNSVRTTFNKIINSKIFFANTSTNSIGPYTFDKVQFIDSSSENTQNLIDILPKYGFNLVDVVSSTLALLKECLPNIYLITPEYIRKNFNRDKVCLFHCVIFIFIKQNFQFMKIPDYDDVGILLHYVFSDFSSFENDFDQQIQSLSGLPFIPLANKTCGKFSQNSTDKFTIASKEIRLLCKRTSDHLFFSDDEHYINLRNKISSYIQSKKNINIQFTSVSFLRNEMIQVFYFLERNTFDCEDKEEIEKMMSWYKLIESIKPDGQVQFKDLCLVPIYRPNSSSTFFANPKSVPVFEPDHKYQKELIQTLKKFSEFHFYDKDANLSPKTLENLDCIPLDPNGFFKTWRPPSRAPSLTPTDSQLLHDFIFSCFDIKTLCKGIPQVLANQLKIFKSIQGNWKEPVACVLIEDASLFNPILSFFKGTELFSDAISSQNISEIEYLKYCGIPKFTFHDYALKTLLGEKNKYPSEVFFILLSLCKFGDASNFISQISKKEWIPTSNGKFNYSHKVYSPKSNFWEKKGFNWFSNQFPQVRVFTYLAYLKTFFRSFF